MVDRPIRVLIADDERDVREPLAMYLRTEGFEVHTAPNGREALELLGRHPVDAVLSDVRMPEIDGMQLLAGVRARYPETKFIMFTAYGTGDDAVAAIRAGAKEYILKPVVFEDIFQKILRICSPGVEAKTGDGAVDNGLAHLDAIRGVSPELTDLKEIVQRVAKAGSSALIVGESGTGKELVARALHHLSSRAGHPFLGVNCAAIPEHLLESEFFGHTKGAFTGAYADKKGLFESAGFGTLFLDEIADLPIHMQAKLLRALEEREVTPVGKTQPVAVRATVVAASGRDLKLEVDAGRFRMDLYYRVNVIEIGVPPLRDRRGDAQFLAEQFLADTRARLNATATTFSPDSLEAISRYDWPGNIRELRNVVERAVVMARTAVIHLDSLPDPVRTALGTSLPPQTLKESVRVFEKDLISRTLRQCDGDKRRTADVLGMGLSSLYRKLDELGIE